VQKTPTALQPAWVAPVTAVAWVHHDVDDKALARCTADEAEEWKQQLGPVTGVFGDLLQ
jgi:hypothetical protein